LQKGSIFILYSIAAKHLEPYRVQPWTRVDVMKRKKQGWKFRN